MVFAKRRLTRNDDEDSANMSEGARERDSERASESC